LESDRALIVYYIAEKQKMKRASSIPRTDEEDLPPKRLRGGGGDDPDPCDAYYPADDLPDEDLPPEEIEDDPATEPATEQSVFSDISPAMRQRWLRPANQVQDNSNDLNLQWFDMDLTAGTPLDKNPNESKTRVVGATNGQVPVIRAYGTTEAGNSVAVFIHGFTPYCYFALPANATFQNTEENLTKIRHSINNRLEGAARGARIAEYCRAVSYVTTHKSIMGHDTPHTHFFKMMVAMPTLIPALKRIMEEGIDLAGVDMPEEDNCYAAFECNVPFVLRYMIDQDVSGAGWLSLPKKTYQVRAESRMQTHCQVRMD
jgi:hypothetical protein